MGKCVVAALAAAAAVALSAGAGAVPALPPAAVHAQDTPRTCGWQLRFDPAVVNTAFPDQSANYWFLNLPAVPGATLTLAGIYPHARYMSFTSYDSLTRAVDGLNDLHVAPQPGDGNPFLTGAARNTPDASRHYVATVVFGQRPSTGAAPNTLYTTSADGSHVGDRFLVIYRVYVADHPLDITGGEPLPTVTYSAPGAAPATLRDCPYPAVPDTGANQQVAYGGTASSSGPAVPFPGTDPPTWHKFDNLPTGFATLTETQTFGDTIAGPATQATRTLPSGGFLENPDNKYISALLSHGFKDMVVVRGRMPTTPPTVDGQPVMAPGELRYWSLCSNDGLSERFYGCVRDDQVALDASGGYTIVVSTAAARPANASAACGITWVPWGPQASTLLILRNMLADPGFPNSVQAARDGSEAQDMGAYFPTAAYASAADVGRLGCGATSASGSAAGGGGGGAASTGAAPGGVATGLPSTARTEHPGLPATLACLTMCGLLVGRRRRAARRRRLGSRNQRPPDARQPRSRAPDHRR